jgi:hypothetical protein
MQKSGSSAQAAAFQPLGYWLLSISPEANIKT